MPTDKIIAAPKARKRIFLINRDFQIRYIWAVVLVGVMTSLLTLVVVLYPMYVFGILRAPTFLPLPILACIFLAIVLNILGLTSIALLMTHRIAGPLYALTRVFRQMEQGVWNHNLQVRKDDELKYVIRSFNSMTSALVADAQADLALLNEIGRQLTAKGGASSGELSPSIAQSIDGLRAKLRRRLQIPGDSHD